MMFKCINCGGAYPWDQDEPKDFCSLKCEALYEQQQARKDLAEAKKTFLKHCGFTSQNTFDKAQRDPIEERFDLIPPEATQIIAQVFGVGAERYGDTNWQKSRLEGEKGPINHALRHINSYQRNDGDKIEHLSHAIVNLIMEYWYEVKPCSKES